MSRVNKIFGPPGTGKTTRLLRIVDEAICAGIRPERIAYMAFTKKAAVEAIERAKEKFNLPDERMPWFRTLHSMAFQSTHSRRDDIMQDEHFQEVGKVMGYRFTSLDDITLMPMGTALGDRVARIDALSRLRCVSLQDQWYQSNLRDVPWAAVEQWSRGLKEYKRQKGLKDYTDLLEAFDETIDVDLFIVDEAQDLSPLQWKVVKKAAAQAKTIYLAGDDDQCIYGWAGADVDMFLRITGQVEVLPESFRLPESVYQLASDVTGYIHRRQPKRWTSNGRQGMVDRVANESLLDLSKGTWMLLSRNHCFLKGYEEVLKNQGYTYVKDGKHSTNNAVTKGILAWEAWRKGRSLKPKEVKQVAKLLPELDRWLPRSETYLSDTPLSDNMKKRNWMDALSVEPSYREYIRACLANGEKLLSKPRIVVSTVHRVKGGEAQHVALIPDLTMQPYSSLNTDEEQRVLYVAITRAQESFTVIQPRSNRHYRI